MPKVPIDEFSLVVDEQEQDKVTEPQEFGSEPVPIDQFQMVEFATYAPVTYAPEPDYAGAKDFYKPDVAVPLPLQFAPSVPLSEGHSRELAKTIRETTGKEPFGVRVNEFGEPIDEEGKPYIFHDKYKGGVKDLLYSLTAGMQRVNIAAGDIIKGISNFGAAIPGATLGLFLGGANSARELINQVASGGLPGPIDLMREKTDVNLLEVFNAGARGFEEGFKLADDLGMKYLKFPETETSMLAQEVLMSPLTAGQESARMASELTDNDNVKGLLMFAGTAVGAVAMGSMLSRGKRRVFGKKLEEVTDKASKVAREEQAINQMPDGAAKKIREQQNEVRKVELNDIANKYAKELGLDALARSDWIANQENIAKAKIRPVRSTGKKKATKQQISKTLKADKDVEVEATAAIGKREYFKAEGKWYDSERKRVADQREVNKLEKVKKDSWLSREKVPEPTREAGVEEVPELSGERSPFFQNDRESIMTEMKYGKVGKVVNTDVEVRLQYLINKVNRWYHGDKVDIDFVRGELSKIAKLNEGELREAFEPNEALQFKGVASEAARWATDMKRPKGPQLNMMIPISEFSDIPVEALDWLRETYGKTKFSNKENLVGILRRNEDLYNKTGLFLIRDGDKLIWTREVPTHKIGMYDVSEGLKEGKTYKLKDVLIDGDEIFKGVPRLEWVRVKYDENAVSPYFDPLTKTIVITEGGLPSYRRTMAHEIAHGIQDAIVLGPGRRGRIQDKGTNVARETVKAEAMNMVDVLKQLEHHDKVDAGIKEAAKEMIKDIDTDLRHETTSPGITVIRRQVLDALLESSKVKNELDLRPLKHTEIAKRGEKRYLSNRGEQWSRFEEFSYNPFLAELPPWERYEMMLRTEGVTKAALSESWPSEAPKLMSGIPGPEFKNVGKKVNEYFDKAKGTKKFKPSMAAKMTKEGFIGAIVDSSGNLKQDLIDTLGQDGYKAVQELVLTRGASSLATDTYKQMAKEVYGGLNKFERDMLDKVLLMDRFIKIRRYKPPSKFTLPGGLDINDVIKYRNAYMLKSINEVKNISPERFELIETRIKTYHKWMRSILEDMYEEGLISETELKALSKHDYRRLGEVIRIEDIYDRKHRTKIGGSKKTVYDSGIQRLAKGSPTTLYEPSGKVMALEVINRAYGRILNNRANKTLLEIARKYEDNPFVRVREEGRSIPSGWAEFNVFENGKRKDIFLSPETARDWTNYSTDLSYRMSNLMRLTLGSPVLRTFATGINWGFALSNFPRDLMHAWYAARVFEGGEWKSLYSPHLPVAAIEMTRDAGTVFFDVVKRGPRTQAYIERGGGMDFLTSQGRLFRRGRHVGTPIEPISDFLSYFGKTSELLGRLMIEETAFKRIAKREGLKVEEVRRNEQFAREATFAARDYLDFNQGGWAAKTIDQAIPYFNAGIQGTRGLLRAFKDNPEVATWKLAQFASVVITSHLAAKHFAPKTFEQMQNDPNSRNSLLIPLGDQFGFLDNNGEMVYPYIKIPIDPSQKFFKKFFEAATNKWLGYEFNAGEVASMLGEMLPADVTTLPPTVSGALGYLTNKDFWLNKDISQEQFGYKPPKALTGESIGGSEEEYTEDTPELARDVGAITGLSPDRLQYAVEELVTSSSMWAWLMGKGYEQVFGNLPEEQKQQHLAEALSNVPAPHRFIGLTNPYTKHGEVVSQEEERAKLKNFVENRGLDMRVQGHIYDGTYSRSDIGKYIRQFNDPETKERLYDRYEFQMKTRHLSNRIFWLKMRDLPVEARARVFYREKKEFSEARKEEILEEVPKIEAIGGVFTDRFYDEYEKLIIQKNREK